MNRYLYLGLVLLLSFFVCTVPTTTQAQEAEQEEEEAVEEYSYGTAIKASDSQLTILEYNYDSDGEVEGTYMLDPSTKVQNVSSIKDIAAGTYVEIDYIVKGGKRIATVITVERETEQDLGPEIEGAESEREKAAVDAGEDLGY